MGCNVQRAAFYHTRYSDRCRCRSVAESRYIRMCIDSSIYIGICGGIRIHRPGARRRDRLTAHAAVLTLYITLHYTILRYITLHYITRRSLPRPADSSRRRAGRARSRSRRASRRARATPRDNSPRRRAGRARGSSRRRVVAPLVRRRRRGAAGWLSRPQERLLFRRFL